MSIATSCTIQHISLVLSCVGLDRLHCILLGDYLYACQNFHKCKKKLQNKKNDCKEQIEVFVVDIIPDFRYMQQIIVLCAKDFIEFHCMCVTAIFSVDMIFPRLRSHRALLYVCNWKFFRRYNFSHATVTQRLNLCV